MAISMNTKIIRSHKFLFSLFSRLLLCLVFLIFTYTGKTQLIMLVKSQKTTDCSVSWQGKNYSYEHSTTIAISLKPNSYQTLKFNIPTRGEDPCSLKVNLGKADSNWEIDYLLIKKSGFKPITIELNTVKTSRDIVSANISNILTFHTSNGCSFVTAELPDLQFHFDWLLLFVCLMLIMVVSMLIFYSIDYFHERKYSFTTLFIAMCLAMVTGLLLLMAIKAGFNASPDERDHFMAAEFFKTHTLTPQKHSREAGYTYNSLWSYSRVYNQGIEYIGSGKFSNIFDYLLDSVHSVRLFGILVFTLFIFLAIRFPGREAILLPLLISPQVWYIFSYVNDDFFPLFLSFLLVILTEAGKNELLRDKKSSKYFLYVVSLGILFGTIMFSKEDYKVFAVFYLIYLILLPVTFSGKYRDDIARYLSVMKKFSRTALFIVGMAILTIGVRQLTLGVPESKGVSPELAAYYQQAQINKEAFLAKGYSGERIYGNYPTMMKSWLPLTYESCFGVYGFMQYHNSKIFNYTQLLIHIALILVILFFVLRKKGFSMKFWLLLFIGVLLLGIFASSYIYSFRYAYQPQGRYLFTALPALGLLFYKIDKTYRDRFVLPLIVLLFIMGVYSFVFVGIKTLCF